MQKHIAALHLFGRPAVLGGRLPTQTTGRDVSRNDRKAPLPATEKNTLATRFRGFSFCWLSIVVVAAAMRILPIYASLPYIDYVDEGYVLHQAIDVLNHKSWDTGWYGYPSLPAYLTVAATMSYAPFYGLIHGHGFCEDLPRGRALHTDEGDNYDLIAPSALIAAGRWAAACVSIGTVLLVGVIALRLAGEKEALLAMLMAALSPALVSRASNVIVDTFATFFALLAMYFADCILRRKDNDKAAMRAALFAGAAAGLAFASKYTVGVVFVGLATAIMLVPRKGCFRAVLVLTALVGSVCAGALMSPATLIKPLAVLKEVATTAHSYSMLRSSPGYLGQAIGFSELGWPALGAACAGMVVLMLRARQAQAFSASWIVFAACLVGLFAAKPFQPFRNLIPLLPGLFVAAATGLMEAWRWAERSRHGRASRACVLLVIVTILGFFCHSSFAALQTRLRVRDTRSSAIDWLGKHVGKDDKLLALAELGVLPTEWSRVPAPVRVVSLSMALMYCSERTSTMS